MNISIKKLFRIILVASICILTMNVADAQRYRDRSNQNSNDPSYDNPDSLSNMSFQDRLVKGANFNLLLGSTTLIDISPILGYRLTPKLQAGIGLTYIYINEQLYDPNTGNPSGHYQETDYGGRLYAEYDIAKNVLSRNSRFFLHAEYENLNVAYLNSFYQIDRMWIPSPYAGVGLRSPMGRKAFFNVSLLYNCNYTAYENYNPNPILVYRVGVTF